MLLGPKRQRTGAVQNLTAMFAPRGISVPVLVGRQLRPEAVGLVAGLPARFVWETCSNSSGQGRYSAHGHDRDAFPTVVPRDALRFWIELNLAIH